LIAGHPRMSLAFATANEQRGTTVRIAGRDVSYVATEDAPLGAAELVFSSLVVDLSSDLRPGHGCEGIPYGLTELAREKLASADVVANPGCYPTSILFALEPLVRPSTSVPRAVSAAPVIHPSASCSLQKLRRIIARTGLAIRTGISTRCAQRSMRGAQAPTSYSLRISFR
jgi:hypothetical protein